MSPSGIVPILINPMQIEHIVILSVIAMAIVGITVAMIAEKQRREAIQQLATRMGFSFERRDSQILGMLKGVLPLFDKGHSRTASNVMRGATETGDFALFDYRYVTGHGKHRRSHHHTVVMIQARHSRLPAMEIRSEHWGHKIASALGFQDIDFPERPDFSKLYIVRSADEAAARTTLNPMFMDFLTAQEQRPSIETNGSCFIYYLTRKRMKPEYIEPFLREAQDAHRALVNTTAETSETGFMGMPMSA